LWAGDFARMAARYARHAGVAQAIWYQFVGKRPELAEKIFPQD
jgi:hypothetical protein